MCYTILQILACKCLARNNIAQHLMSFSYTVLCCQLTAGQIEYDCIFGMVNCTNGGCINANLVCDGSVDCLSDESDEEDCRKW